MEYLALRAMLGDRSKLLISLAGVAFSVVLMNLQGGLFLGLIRKASLLVDNAQADIWVGHRLMDNVDNIGTSIPERWVDRLRGTPGVERADPYVVTSGWLIRPDGAAERVIVVGSDAASLLGNAWVMAEGNAEAIRQPDGILVDVCDAARLGDCRPGAIREINGHRARIVGRTYGIVGFTTNPYVFTTLDRARYQYTVGLPEGHCSYFLVKAKPGVSIASLVAQLRERVPQLEVYDRQTFSWMCRDYWMRRTGIGLSFGLATLLGLLVGLLMVAQTLYAAVNERLKEFATLKALGAKESKLACFLMLQALTTAFLGCVLGLTTALAIGCPLSTPRVPIVFEPWLMAGSAVLVALMCLMASWLPYSRLRRIDPACVLRS